MDGGSAPDPNQVIQPEQSIPETVLEESNPGQHIEVAYHDENENVETAPVLTDEPAHLGTVEHSDDGLVDDVSKAWDMAHAGKNNHDEAAEIRKTSGDDRKLLAEAEDLSKMPLETDEDKAIYDDRYKSFSDKRDRTSKASNAMDRDHYLDEVILGEGSHLNNSQKSAKDRLESKIASGESRAPNLDKAAEKLEDWAAILHDHPISEAYLETHPGINFDVLTLAYMDGRTQKEKEVIKTIEEALEKSSATVGVFGLSHEYLYLTRKDDYRDLGPFRVMEEAYGLDPDDRKDLILEEKDLTDENKEMWATYHEMRDNPDTTLGQLREMYIEAFKKAHVEPSRSYVGSVESVIEDVKSGRASA